MSRIVAALAASLVLLTAAAPAAVSAELPEPSASPSASADALPPETIEPTGMLTARLVDLASPALDPSSRLTATITATNRSSLPVDDVVVELRLTEQPLGDREALDAFLADPSTFSSRLAAQQPEPPEETAAETAASTPADLPGVVGAEDDVEAEPEPVGVTIAAGTSRTVTIGASPSELGLPAGRWGVYGAVLTLQTANGPIAVDAVPLTWQGAAVPELTLTTLSTAAGTQNRVANQLGASNVAGVTTAVDPAPVTNAMAFDSGLVVRESWRLASGSPDLTSLAHAGETTLMDLALSVPAGTNLASIGSAPWLAVPAALDAASTNAASALGAGAVLALPEAEGFEDLEEQADAAVARAGDALVLVPDASLSRAIAQYRPGTEAAQARVIAESALLADEADGAPVLAVLDDSWRPGSSAPSDVLESLMTAPWVDPLPVSALLETDADPVTLPATLGTDADLAVNDVAALAAALVELTTLSSATTSPSAALADWGTDLLQGAAVRYRSNPGLRGAAVSAALARVDATLASLRIAESSDLNLLAESGEIPVTIVNGLDHDVDVRVDLTSFSPNLQVLASPTITVPAGAEGAALVPVEAVSSANVRVAVVLRSTDGLPASDAQTFAVRVRADWGNAATAVFSVLLVLLLVAGLVRTARRGRRDTRAEPAPAPTTEPDGDTENVPFEDGDDDGEAAGDLDSDEPDEDASHTSPGTGRD
ncbi:DUF6049 family protein [Demequina aestuarii]|uniref:DUF6049 family protein n=1 Tax=Demequina aestuarii TaxID=327095 RepID=UPI000780FDD5|nr:DUF6049 family protein [Demequina aestuarii]